MGLCNRCSPNRVACSLACWGGGDGKALAGDLRELREGKISVNDAIARAHLAKQIFNGFRIYLNASKMLADNAKPAALQARKMTND